MSKVTDLRFVSFHINLVQFKPTVTSIYNDVIWSYVRQLGEEIGLLISIRASQKVLKLIFKSHRFVPLGANMNMTNFEPESGI